MARAKTWALVTNGISARILRSLERDGAVHDQELVRKTKAPHVRQVLLGRPGGSYPLDARGAWSAKETGADLILRDMAHFAQEVSDLLECHCRAGDFRQLAVFAPPRMMTILRQEFSAALIRTLTWQRAVDLMNLSQPDLRRAVLLEIRTRVSPITPTS